MKKIKISWLGLLNIIIFQWFFVRLTKCQEKVVEEYIIQSFDMMIDGSFASRGTGKSTTYQWYSLQYWILPLTGWKSDFVYLSKSPNFVKITKKNAL